MAEEPPASLSLVLHALRDLLRDGRKHAVLREVPLKLRKGEQTVHLDLLLLPSVFAPEDWSMTFLEGLLRKPLREYRGKRLIELGTGSGWISLALLRLSELHEALGVDLNPQAVLLARLNAILNGYDEAGSERPDRLAARFHSAESDLLSVPRQCGLAADLIVACIPQVPAKSADFETSQGLHDLSNYALVQGLFEDQFGLGLNARALRESLCLLEHDGRVILNLAGRPGLPVLQQMFRRRGFEPKPLWHFRVQQAADTDIQPLVELEARTGQSFAFHLHRHSPQSLSAKVAQAALQGGHPIFHELWVLEGRPRSSALYGLARELLLLGMESLWERVDLSAASDEQLRFVTRLAEELRHRRTAPYVHEAGDLLFRRRVTDFLRKFHSLPLPPESAFVAPNRGELLQALLLTLTEPGARVVLSSCLREIYGPAVAKFGAEALWAHDDADELVELMPHLRPRLVVLGPPAEGTHPREALHRLLACCETYGAMLVLDETERFVISSRELENRSFAFMAQHILSAHLAVLVGLVHSRPFPDVGLALLFSSHPRLQTGLEVAAEVTYSRISVFNQAYYDSLFQELLTFQVQGLPEKMALPLESAAAPPLSSTVEALLAMPPFSRPAPAADVIRLDYGENEHPIPMRLVAGVLRGFLVPPASAGRTPKSLLQKAREAASGYLAATRLPHVRTEDVVLVQGTLPLLFDAVRALGQELGRPPVVGLPQGSYGVLPALVAAARADLRILATAGPDFLVEPSAVTAAGPLDLLLLTNPANPSGAAYAPELLRALIRQAASRGCRVITDEVFGMLADLDGPLPVGQDRWAGLSQAEMEALLILCGVSKEFAAGGLRLGFAACRSSRWLSAIKALQLAPLPQSTLIAGIDLLAGLPAHWEDLTALRRTLAERRRRLAEALTELGWLLPPSAGRGGLFLFPDVRPVAGGDANRFVLRLEEEAGVRLNTPAWSGTATHARACFALEDAQLDEAIVRLRRWHAQRT